MKNSVKSKFENKERVIGTFFELGSAYMGECFKYTGLDFVIIDAEHGPLDHETVIDLIRAVEMGGVSPFVRIPDVSHSWIQKMVDGGAQAMIVPCLNSVAEVKELVRQAKYPPIGMRGYCPCRNDGWGFKEEIDGKSTQEYMEICNNKCMVIPQCETVGILENIEEVVNIEGVDGIFIGPFDLSISLGIPKGFDNPIFIAAVDRVYKACKAAGKPVIIFNGNIEKSKSYLEQGFDGIAYGLDIHVLADAYKEIVRAIKG